MQNKVRFIGLDVHAGSIVIAVAEGGGQQSPAVWKKIPYNLPQLLDELRLLGRNATLRVCYEAGPTGFGLQRFLRSRGIDCVVVAPALVPRKPGVRIKTDRRDACNLAQYLRSGDLTPIWIPDEQTEAIRDLERAREDARLAERRARQHLLKFLLRHDRRFTEGKHHWTQRHWRWILQQRFEHEALNRVLADYIRTAQEASDRVRRLSQDIGELIQGWALAPLVKNLQAFHGIQELTAVALSAEIGNFQRFRKATQIMAFTGLIPSEHTTGENKKQGGITKTGNKHVRRLLLEAGWHYYDCGPGASAALQKRREGVPPEIVAIAEKARRRLRAKAHRMRLARKTPNKIAVALARELIGFIWAAALASGMPPAETQAAPAASAPPDRTARNHPGQRLRKKDTGPASNRRPPRPARLGPAAATPPARTTGSAASQPIRAAVD